MIDRVKDFLIKLPERDEETRKMWLVILTSFSMVVVITFWAVYLDYEIPSLSRPVVVETAGSENFLAVLESGAGVVSEKTGLKLSRIVSAVKTAVSKTNSIKIEKTSDSRIYQEFIKKDLEDVEVKKLP